MIQAGQDVAAQDLINIAPVGVVFPYAGPTGTSSAVAIAGNGTATAAWLYCTGTAVSRTVYATLFAAIGTTYGAGNGTTTFNLPDLRGRIPLGSGTGAGDGKTGTATGTPTGTALSIRTIGEWGGEEKHQLTTAELASHTHTSVASASGGGGSGTVPANAGGAGISNFETASGGSDTPHNNMTPFLVLNYIIRASYN